MRMLRRPDGRGADFPPSAGDGEERVQPRGPRMSAKAVARGLGLAGSLGIVAPAKTN